MEKQINQKRKELIGNWFYNIKHSIENEEILFITNRENTLTFENEIHHLLNTYIIPRNYEGTEYNIFNSIDLEKDKTLLSKKNIILIGYNQLSINKISLNKKILCYNFKNGIELNEIKFKGGGGTCIKDTLDHAARSDAVALFIITDGYMNLNLMPLHKPTIWCVYNNKKFKEPFGSTVLFDKYIYQKIHFEVH